MVVMLVIRADNDRSSVSELMVSDVTMVVEVVDHGK